MSKNSTFVKYLETSAKGLRHLVASIQLGTPLGELINGGAMPLYADDGTAAQPSHLWADPLHRQVYISMGTEQGVCGSVVEDESGFTVDISDEFKRSPDADYYDRYTDTMTKCSSMIHEHISTLDYVGGLTAEDVRHSLSKRLERMAREVEKEHRLYAAGPAHPTPQ